MERRERMIGEIGGKEREEERRRERLRGLRSEATAETPDVCTRLAPMRTDRRKTGLSDALECDGR
jgi:hypothetical protein